MFTVLSFLTTTGFESAEWDVARNWSGLGTPGFVLMSLALVGGGVATTAGGVKLLRVYALYLQGLGEMERLVHPSVVIGGRRAGARRIRRRGAVIAWVYFMLFAMSLAAITVVLAALGSNFEEALILAISALTTTGPLTQIATETPIAIFELNSAEKLILCAAMVLGRLETLAIIALMSPDLWHK
jgi:trk system potassium uptake protein TrkH